MSSRRNSASSIPGLEKRSHIDVSGNVIYPVKKYLNGWTPEQERLMAKWADIAGCYRWLHEKAEKGFSRGNALITIPVIILSTLTGTASFALSSFIAPDDIALKNYAQACIGSISIFVGILTTLGNFLRYAQGSEAHRVAGVAWGKIHRQITVEVAIHPDDREDSMTFLQICRQDLDRLVEQSPPIPDRVIAAFEKEFSDVSGLQRPDICHGLEHTTVYNSTKPRLMKMVTEATIFLKQRKKLLRDDIFPDLSSQISKTVETELDKKIHAKWDDLDRKFTQIHASIKKPEVLKINRNNSFTTNWRRFIRRSPKKADTDDEGDVRDEIYRDNSDDCVVSIQSESTHGSESAHSVTVNEIIENGSSSSSTSGMVISMTVNPPSIVIPNTTPVADLSGSITSVAVPEDNV